MMPGICHYSLGMIFSSGFNRKLISPLLHHDTYDGCNQGYNARLLECLAADGTISLGYTRIADHHTHHEERNADDGCGKRFVFAMTIIMVLILRLIAQFYEYQYHHIGSEIGERVDGIRYHCCRMSKDTSSKFQYEQHHIDDASRYRHLIYFLYSIRISGMILFRFSGHLLLAIYSLILVHTIKYYRSPLLPQ